jgi:hypothetical protein
VDRSRIDDVELFPRGEGVVPGVVDRWFDASPEGRNVGQFRAGMKHGF